MTLGPEDARRALDAALQATGYSVGTKYGQSIEISDEVAHDHGLCTCPGGVCTYEPPPPPPLPSRRLRAWYWLRRRWRGVKRLPGYRLVHKDDLPDPANWPY